MSRTRVLFLGEDKKDPIQHAAADYLARARVLDAVLLPLEPAKRSRAADDDKVRAAEALDLLKHSEGCTRIALDPRAKPFASSEALAADLQKRVAAGRPVAFLIGGATGLHPSVLQAADAHWSLSALTYAHRLAVLVLCEQLYRATEIWRGGPYHK